MQKLKNPSRRSCSPSCGKRYEPQVESLHLLARKIGPATSRASWPKLFANVRNPPETMLGKEADAAVAATIPTKAAVEESGGLLPTCGRATGQGAAEGPSPRCQTFFLNPVQEETVGVQRFASDPQETNQTGRSGKRLLGRMVIRATNPSLFHAYIRRASIEAGRIDGGDLGETIQSTAAAAPTIGGEWKGNRGDKAKEELLTCSLGCRCESLSQWPITCVVSSGFSRLGTDEDHRGAPQTACFKVLRVPGYCDGHCHGLGSRDPHKCAKT